jgi:hypothetical protein
MDQIATTGGRKLLPADSVANESKRRADKEDGSTALGETAT